MDLYRVFSWDGRSLGNTQGGPLFVARDRQGGGRHDTPSRYGAWYCSRESVSAVAESVQYLRGPLLTDEDLQRPGNLHKALVALRLDDDLPLIDMDDPRELLSRGVRPSGMATNRRRVTQRVALSVFEEGVSGFSWWSTLEAEWTNVTLFHERVVRSVRIVAPPRKLTTSMLEVRTAADYLGLRI